MLSPCRGIVTAVLANRGGADRPRRLGGLARAALTLTSRQGAEWIPWKRRKRGRSARSPR